MVMESLYCFIRICKFQFINNGERLEQDKKYAHICSTPPQRSFLHNNQAVIIYTTPKKKDALFITKKLNTIYWYR